MRFRCLLLLPCLLRTLAAVGAFVLFAAAPVGAQFMPGEGRSSPNAQGPQYAAMVSRQVDSVFSRWRGAMEQNDPRAIAELYTKNAVVLLGDSLSFRGRKELREMLSGMGRVDEVRTTSAGFATSSEVAVEEGFMTVIFDLPNGGTRVVHGPYTITFRRQDLGEWLIEMQSLGLALQK